MHSTLNNCTLTGNSATGLNGSGGGAYYGTLNNCIVYYNRLKSLAAEDNSPKLSYSNHQGATLKHVVGEVQKFIDGEKTPGITFRLAGGNAGGADVDEVILVDDASRDDTARIARELGHTADAARFTVRLPPLAIPIQRAQSQTMSAAKLRPPQPTGLVFRDELLDLVERLNADGSVDTTFNPGAGSTVQTFTVQPDGRVLVGGDFTWVGDGTDNIARLRLARLGESLADEVIHLDIRHRIGAWRASDGRLVNLVNGFEGLVARNA